MKAFLVQLNGEHLCTAGVGDDGVLSAIIAWRVSGHPRLSIGELEFAIGGIDKTNAERLKWAVPKPNVGDEIVIKIIETDQIAPEPTRTPFDKPEAYN